MSKHRTEVLQAGRNVGAGIGIIVFLAFGIIPSFHFGSYGALMLLSHLAGLPIEPGILVRILLVFGAGMGILCGAFLSIVGGSIIGTTCAYAIDLVQSIFEPAREEEEEQRQERFFPAYSRITEEGKRHILARMSFIYPHLDGIHSVVLIGSVAYNLQEKGSDTDIVIICKNSGYVPFREFIFDREVEERKNESESPFEFIVLNTDLVEEYFRLGTPFAYAIRQGTVLIDDGYLRELVRSDYPLNPVRKYFLNEFYENIAVQYYGALTKAEKEIKNNQCSDSCCAKKEGCQGILPADTLSKVIMRMLYVILASRGNVPLTKKEVIDATRRFYGEESKEVLERATHILKNDTARIFYDDYKRLKPFAVRLFRETLSLIGIKKDVLKILRNAARLMRGDYSAIDDDVLRKCVI